MANKRVKHARRKKRGVISFYLLLILGILVLVLYWFTPKPESKEKPFILGSDATVLKELTKSKFEEQIGWIMEDSPESRLLPVSVRQKVSYLIQLKKQGKLLFLPYLQPINQLSVQMNCACDIEIMKELKIDVPAIVVFPYMAEFTRNLSKLQQMIAFAISLYHESVHLEHCPLSSHPTDKELLDEEVSAYSRTSLEVVRPMIESGQWVPDFFRTMDQIFRSCGDDINCPQFRNFVSKPVQANSVLPRR